MPPTLQCANFISRVICVSILIEANAKDMVTYYNARYAIAHVHHYHFNTFDSKAQLQANRLKIKYTNISDYDPYHNINDRI